MATRGIELRDTDGNVYYPKTTADNVSTAEGKTVEHSLNEIAAGIALDFDILCSSKGHSCTMVEGNGGCTETLTSTATAKKAAVRTTTKVSNGYKEVITFYGNDGLAVLETRTKMTTKTGNGYMEVTV